MIPTPPQPEEILDVGDLVKLATAPTSGLVTVEVGEDAMDPNVPDALPTMVRRPPTIDGTVESVRNAAEGGVAGVRRRPVRLLPARPNLDELRNIYRCGTYTRIREAIKAAATKM